MWLFPEWLSFLAGLGAHYKRRTLWGVLSAGAARVCDLLPVIIVGQVVDTIARQAATGETGQSSVFFLYGALILAAFAGLGLFQSISDYLLTSMAHCVRHDLRMTLFRHIQNQDMQFFDTRLKGDLLSVITNDIDTLHTFFAETTGNIIRIIIFFLGTYAYLFWLDYRLALILAAPLPVVFFAIALFSRSIQPRYLKARQAIGNFSGIMENSLQGVAVIQAYNAQHNESKRLDKQSLRYRNAAIDAARIRGFFIPGLYCLAGLSFGLLIGMGGFASTLPDGPSIGTYTTFVLMGMRLVVPLFILGFLINTLEQAKAAITRIRELLETPIQVTDRPDPTVTGPPEEIRFDRVSFRYNDLATLQNISFTLQAGQHTGIAGQTGSGKSTLIKLLLRFYRPDQGSIQINGVPLNDIAITSFRRHISYVPQQPFLLHGTIRENICLGESGFSQEEIDRAASAACIDRFIASAPEGYETVIGDGGTTLSGGERQRIALVRALVRRPHLLILDEATSAIDAKTEYTVHNNIYNDIYGMNNAMTVIAIAHRLSTLTCCDTIFLLEDGLLTEQGTHSSLIEKKGAYARLWNAFLHYQEQST